MRTALNYLLKARHDLANELRKLDALIQECEGPPRTSKNLRDPEVTTAGKSLDLHSDFPLTGTWPAKIVFALKIQGEPILKEELMDVLSGYDTYSSIVKIKKGVENNLPRLVSDGRVAQQKDSKHVRYFIPQESLSQSSTISGA